MDGKSLHLDQALLTIYNERATGQKLHFLSQIDACIGCPLQERLSVKPNRHGNVRIDTAYGNSIVVKADNDVICEMNDFPFKDQGKYELHVNDKCDWHTVEDGRNNIYPLLVAALLILVVFSVYQFILFINRRRNETHEASGEQQQQRRKPRVNCVDAFRGMVILLMIFANTGSGEYVFLNHSAWFGFHLADCVFPFFMFIMGITIAISLQSQMRRVEPELSWICLHVFRRSITLFVLGLMINSLAETRLTHLRIPGVLQRFAICYLLVAVLHLVSLYETRRGLGNEEVINTSFRRHFIDIYPYWIEWLFVIAMSAIYFSLTFDWKYDPNCPVGYQGPGGLYDNEKYPNCTGGAARALDIFLLGENHIYIHSSAHKVYENELPHDPEGVLGTTTSIILVFLGLQAGKIFTCYRSHRQRILRWILWCLISGLLTVFLYFNGSIPVVKNLWSMTYVTFSAFLGFIVLIILYLLIDVKMWWLKGTPFNIPGMNSIFLYVGHEVCHKMFPFYFNVDPTSHAWLLFRSLLATTLWFLISVIMYKKRIFITL